MNRFNKDRYIGDDSYEVPWRSFKGPTNAEGIVRGHLEVLQESGYVDWDDHATVTDMGLRHTGFTSHMDSWTSPARSIVVEGVSNNGEEVVFVKHITPRGESHSYIYIDGKRFSAYKITESLKQGSEEHQRRVVKRKEARKRKTWGRPGIEKFEVDEDLDWS